MDPIVSRWLAYGAVFAAAIACYWNSADGDFVFDDSEAIVDNKDVTGVTDIWTLWHHDFWGDKIASKTSHKSYRPLTVITFRWNYWLAGGLHPWLFHVTNIALHGLCSLMFYAVAELLLGEVNTKEDRNAPAHLVRVHTTVLDKSTWWCALLFAAHPVHSESVAGVVGRADLLSAVSFFAALLLFSRACHNAPQSATSAAETGHGSERGPRRDTKADIMRHSRESSAMAAGPVTEYTGHGGEVRTSWLFVFFALLSTAVSMLCKEQGITALGLIFVFDMLYVSRVSPREAARALCDSAHRSKVISRLSVHGFVQRQVAVILAGMLCLAGRWSVMGGTTPTFQLMDNPASFSNSTLTRALSYNYVYALNAWILLCPIWLCFDWAMGCIPLIESLADGRWLAGAALWLVVIAIVRYCFQDARSPQQRASQQHVAFGLALVAVPFLPASNLFFRVGFVVAERILYLPSAGFCILVAVGGRKLWSAAVHRGTLGKAATLAGCGLLVLAFVARSAQRSHEWRREELLFSAGATVCPLNAKVHYNIGKGRADMGDAREAEASYREAVRLHPTYGQALNNLGNLLKEHGNLHEAHKFLQGAVDADSKFAAAWMNLGIVKADLKMYKDSEECYTQAVRHRRNYPDAWYNLGNLHLQTKQYESAAHAWGKAIEQKTAHHGARHNLALMYEETNRPQEALQVLRESTKVLPSSPDLWMTMGNVCGRLEMFKQSEQAFKASVKHSNEPAQQANAWANLGVLYHRAKQWSEAETAYATAERLAPGQTAAKGNLEMLQRSRKG